MSAVRVVGVGIRGLRAVAFLSLITACSSDAVPGTAGAFGGAGASGVETAGQSGGTAASAGTSGGGGPAMGGTSAAGAPLVGTGGGSGAAGGVLAAGGSSSTSAGGLPSIGGSAGITGGGGVSNAGGMNGVAGVAAGGFGGASGAAGASGSAGAGGAASYNPCPAGGMPCKILPLGDSITYGLGTSDGGGYRSRLFHDVLADGKHVTFLGTQMNGPMMVDGVSFPRGNEGHSGWTINQIAGLIPKPAFDDHPDIVLLMAGTNDMYMGDPSTAPQRFAALLDKTISADSHPLIVAAQLTPLGSGDSQVQAYNAALPPIVEERAAAGKHVVLVNMHDGFTTSMLSDGVHPNAQGYERMASVWYAAIGPLLH